MKYRIVSDSTSNLLELPGSIEYRTVPLKIIVDGKEYIDRIGLDIASLVEAIEKGEKTGTSCPNSEEYLQAYGGADCVFAITITSGLSGSYNAAEQGARQFREENPNAKIHVIDSLSTGGEMHLIIEKLKELMEQGLPFEEIQEKVEEYRQRTHLLFSLESVTNLAKNGRLPMAVAKIANLLNIRFIGKPTENGTIRPVHNVRGAKKNISKIVEEMVNMGYEGGKVWISHCLNPEAASNLKAAILSKFPAGTIGIEPMTALCSYYAERGGMIIGFEGGLK
ncbi:MAG: DegV family protein [Solobacterium sp.]|nr:DegV family protein [Solobacterium sp.]